jgi:Zn-dependent M28 family amino/carboxypeptidase
MQPFKSCNRHRAAVLAVTAVTAVAVLAAPGRAAEGAGFNGSRAFQDLRYIVSLGPRPPGSKALATERHWITGKLKQAGWSVEDDAYTADTPIGAIPEVNLIAKLPGGSPKVIMIAGHYDTKIFEQFRFVGANDGGSSAAFLLEMARVLAGEKHPYTYWLVFFDGEEAVREWSPTDSLYGSRHLVGKLSASGELNRIQAMILVDMIGGSHLQIYPDTESTDWLDKLVFKTADRLGYARYFPSEPTSLSDDHNPFVNAGVSAVDLLGPVGPLSSSSLFGRYWHTAQDTITNCSPRSLTIAGRVVTAVLEELEKSPRLR